MLHRFVHPTSRAPWRVNGLRVVASRATGGLPATRGGRGKAIPEALSDS
jgi:hypothetical protein